LCGGRRISMVATMSATSTPMSLNGPMQITFGLDRRHAHRQFAVMPVLALRLILTQNSRGSRQQHGARGISYSSACSKIQRAGRQGGVGQGKPG